MDSDAPSSDWMQADKASCDSPWNTALWWNKRETSPVALQTKQKKFVGCEYSLLALIWWIYYYQLQRVGHDWATELNRYSSQIFLLPHKLSRPAQFPNLHLLKLSRDHSTLFPEHLFRAGLCAGPGSTVAGAQGRCDLTLGSSLSSTISWYRLFFKHTKPTLKQSLSKSTSKNISQVISVLYSKIHTYGSFHNII